MDIEKESDFEEYWMDHNTEGYGSVSPFSVHLPKRVQQELDSYLWKRDFIDDLHFREIGPEPEWDSIQYALKTLHN